jgi:hypothetical protein
MIWMSLVGRPLDPAHTRHRHSVTREIVETWCFQPRTAKVARLACCPHISCVTESQRRDVVHIPRADGGFVVWSDGNRSRSRR